MWERFQQRLTKLPKAWFRRKKRLIEIAYHSRLGTAEELIGSRADVDRVALVRSGYREVVQALQTVGRVASRSDHFNAAAFIAFLLARQAALDTVSDQMLAESLEALRESERQRVASRTVA